VENIAPHTLDMTTHVDFRDIESLSHRRRNVDAPYTTKVFGSPFLLIDNEMRFLQKENFAKIDSLMIAPQ
jgi:hypothetical protein